MRHIIGITRFALLGPMGEGQFIFPHRKKPKQFTRAEWVHSPGYLAHRLMMWQAFALPSIEALMAHLPAGYTYTHLVVTNFELPNLLALQATFPWYVRSILIEPSSRLEKGLDAPLRGLAVGEEFFSFRLDDDDALAHDYLDMVARTWEKGYEVITPVEGFFIGINRRKNNDQLRLVPAINAGSPHGIGAFNQNIHALGKHNAIPQTVGIDGRVYWLRSVHRSNVSLAGHAGTPWGRTHADVAPLPMLERWFPYLNPERMRAALCADPATLV